MYFVEYVFYKNGIKLNIDDSKRKKNKEKQLDAVLVNETKACNTSIRLHRLPLTFTLSLQLKILIKANYNQQMCST